MAITVERIGAGRLSSPGAPSIGSTRQHDRRAMVRPLHRSRVECVGAFPEALASGYHLRRATLSITEEAVVIAADPAASFSLLFDDIVTISLIPSSLRSVPALHIRYQPDTEDEIERGFTVAAYGVRARIDGRRRIVNAARLLASAGIPITKTSRGTHPRSLALSWPDARAHTAELMVWSGQAVAPVGGWMARDRAVCKVWLTDQSLFWCDPAGFGVNRLPIADIHDITIDADQRIPALAIALADAAGDRQELPFTFAGDRYVDGNRHECQTLIRAFAGRDIPIRTHRGGEAVVAFDPIAEPTVTTFADGVTEQDPEDATPQHLASLFEAGCLAEIALLNQQILNPSLATEAVDTVPEHVALSDALDAVADQIATGEITIADADGRVKRLHLLAESRSKLRAIRAQQIKGIRSKSALLHQRTAVISALGGILN